MPLTLLDGVAIADFASQILAWFADGIFWGFSAVRRQQIRIRWAERGSLYEYAQVLSWWLALLALAVLVLFVSAAFSIR